jgi:hypothetical protein
LLWWIDAIFGSFMHLKEAGKIRKPSSCRGICY